MRELDLFVFFCFFCRTGILGMVGDDNTKKETVKPMSLETASFAPQMRGQFDENETVPSNPGGS
jgi:hypothetical protein